MNSGEVIFWLSPWEPSVLVPCVLALSVIAYFRGCRRYPQPWYCQMSFYGGLASFYAATLTQFDYYAQHEFFMNRLQQGTLQHFAPFLIALARPGAALGMGVPDSVQRLLSRLFQWPLALSVLRILNHPVTAISLFCGLIAFWLIPSVHFLTMLDVRIYSLMNWSMAINGLMFWNLALNNHMLIAGRLSAGSRIALMFAVIWPQIAIGIVLFSSPHVLYPLYSLCGLAFSNLSALADQQLGGMILWVHGAMMSVMGILIILQREWLPRRSL